MFRGFDSSLAVGLMRGQVLTCALATASARNLATPHRGPWLVITWDGVRRAYESPLDAARHWRHFLDAQSRIDNYKRTC